MSPFWQVVGRVTGPEPLLVSVPHVRTPSAGLERWKCQVREKDKSIKLSCKVNDAVKQETSQRFPGFDHVFREEVSSDVVFQKVEEPLLLDFWNGASCSLIYCGFVENYAALVRRPLDALFVRINEATTVSQSVIRFKVSLEIVDIHTDSIIDALSKEKRRLHVGPDGECIPKVSCVAIDSAAQGVDIVRDLEKRTSTEKPKSKLATARHRVVRVCLERMVRKRKTGLLAPRRLDTNKQSQENNNKDHVWATTKSTLRLVHISVKQSRVNRANTTPDHIGAHASAHTHKLEKEVAQTLTSFCRCLRDDSGYRDAKLTHILKQSFQGDSRCTFVAQISSPSSDYSHCAGPLRFAERVIRALRSQPDVLGKPVVQNISTTQDTSEREKEDTDMSDFITSGIASEHSKLQEESLQSERVFDWLSGFHDNLEMPSLDMEPNDTSQISHEVQSQSRSRSNSTNSLDRSREFTETKTNTASELVDLDASRKALREQLGRFQQNKGLLKSKHDESLGDIKLLTHEKRIEETEKLVTKLEVERREALDKGRGLMQQVWQLDAERGDALHKSRMLEEKVAFLEAERQANVATISELRQEFTSQMESEQKRHLHQMQNLRDAVERKIESEKKTLVEQREKHIQEKLESVSSEKQRMKEALGALEIKQKEELENVRNAALAREAELKEKLKMLQSQKLDEHEKNVVQLFEKETKIRQLEDKVNELNTIRAIDQERSKLQTAEERNQLEYASEEKIERIKQLEHELAISKKISAERERHHESERKNLQTKLNGANEQVISLTRECAAREREIETLQVKLQQVALGTQGKTEYEVLTMQLESKTNEAQSLMQLSSELSSAHENLCKELDQANSEIEHLNARVQVLEAELRESRIDLQAGRAKLEEFDHMKGMHRSQLETAERSLEHARATQQQLNANAERQSQKIRELENEIGLLKKEAEETTAKRDKESPTTNPVGQELLNQVAEQAANRAVANLQHVSSTAQQPQPSSQDHAFTDNTRDALRDREREAHALREQEAHSLREHEVNALREREARALREREVNAIRGREAWALREREVDALREQEVRALREQEAARRLSASTPMNRPTREDVLIQALRERDALHGGTFDDHLVRALADRAWDVPPSYEYQRPPIYGTPMGRTRDERLMDTV
eukprot:CAMPEP_0203747134 /NCGR_PEP_ID=MMETSP0098-20131031/2367_1 /ASSEMBLY_ACC=CAM_ASM_000208 /TAXON_ID=96639 /ORGANISM=" , Strain NY0313808BC1" /LENGTH=1157 /DNA_ID=CAMNT_0050635471 /DNA_START=1815 /DNA_END=5284 /DNA_ORIENTATION=-